MPPDVCRTLRHSVVSEVMKLIPATVVRVNADAGMLDPVTVVTDTLDVGATFSRRTPVVFESHWTAP